MRKMTQELHEHWASKFALVLQQQDDGEEVTLRVRRVIPSGGAEELQIEITITEIGKRRNRTFHSSVILSPALADKLADACRTLR